MAAQAAGVEKWVRDAARARIAKIGGSPNSDRDERTVCETFVVGDHVPAFSGRNWEEEKFWDHAETIARNSAFKIVVLDIGSDSHIKTQTSTKGLIRFIKRHLEYGGFVVLDPKAKLVDDIRAGLHISSPDACFVCLTTSQEEVIGNLLLIISARHNPFHGVRNAPYNRVFNLRQIRDIDRSRGQYGPMTTEERKAAFTGSTSRSDLYQTLLEIPDLKEQALMELARIGREALGVRTLLDRRARVVSPTDVVRLISDFVR